MESLHIESFDHRTNDLNWRREEVNLFGLSDRTAEEEVNLRGHLRNLKFVEFDLWKLEERETLDKHSIGLEV